MLNHKKHYVTIQQSEDSIKTVSGDSKCTTNNTNDETSDYSLVFNCSHCKSKHKIIVKSLTDEIDNTIHNTNKESTFSSGIKCVSKHFIQTVSQQKRSVLQNIFFKTSVSKPVFITPRQKHGTVTFTRLSA